MPKLNASIYPDSQIAKQVRCGRKKTTQILTQIIAPANVENISDDICLKNMPYSIIVDESTDITTTKTLAVVIRYFCGANVKDRFLDMIEVTDQTAIQNVK